MAATVTGMSRLPCTDGLWLSRLLTKSVAWPSSRFSLRRTASHFKIGREATQAARTQDTHAHARHAHASGSARKGGDMGLVATAHSAQRSIGIFPGLSSGGMSIDLIPPRSRTGYIPHLGTARERHCLSPAKEIIYR